MAEVIVLQHTTSEEMGIKTPLIDHQYYLHDHDHDHHHDHDDHVQAPHNIHIIDEEDDDALVVTGRRREKKDSDMLYENNKEDDDGSKNIVLGEKSTTNNVYFDTKHDASKECLLDESIKNALSAVINGETPSAILWQEDGSTSSKGQTENLQVDIVDEIDEEVIELEFERAAEKIHTHQGYEVYCPNCSNRITKVVLRRRIVKRVPTASSDKPLDLLGCVSCFSIFVAAGNKLNPFRLFGRGKETKSSSLSQETSNEHLSITSSTHSSSTVQHQQTSSVTSSTQITDTTSTITRSTQVEDITSSVTSSTQIKGKKRFDLFSVFWKGKVKGNDINTQPSSVHTIEQSIDASKGSSSGSYNIITDMRLHGKPFQGSKCVEDVIIDINNDLDGIIEGVKHPASLGTTANQQEGGDVQVSVQTESTTETNVSAIQTEEPSSKSLEIVKAIVYGGLMELIASLSVVSSGAASGVTTMKILALGLANLVSGLIVLGNNFSDLKYGEFSQSEEAIKRYKELLGRKEHFLLHAVIAVLSYIVFGIVPVVTYGFTFRESDNRDYKLLAVAGASLLCIIILAVMKTYTRGQHKFSVYFKALVYYITCAVLVSGVAYAVGDLASKLMEKSGWWDSSPVHALLITNTKSNPAFASF